MGHFTMFTVPPADSDTATPALSLRDYFAAQAMAGMLASLAHSGSAPDRIAEWAYMQADAMMAARKET